MIIWYDSSRKVIGSHRACPDIRTTDLRTSVYKDTYLAFNKGQHTEGQMTKKQMNIYYPKMNYITIFM